MLAAVEGAEAAAAPGCRRENDGQRRQLELQPGQWTGAKPVTAGGFTGSEQLGF